MPRFLVLRLEGPLMSFGTTTVGQGSTVPTELFPGRSMLTGLLANALGWTHGDTVKLRSLQSRIRFAARIEREGDVLIDFQTVDRSQPFMTTKASWTFSGQPDFADEGKGTLIRRKHYVEDSVVIVALGLDGDEAPGLMDIAEALDTPARPLFLGRACCPPGGRIYQGAIDAESPLDALCHISTDTGVTRFHARWDASLGADGFDILAADDRDWANGVHTGGRMIREGYISLKEATV